jgi:hypothetical protein
VGLPIKIHLEGKQEGMNVPGEKVKIGKYEGILVDREQYVELWWILPAKSVRKGCEIVFSGGKRTPRDELIEITRSIG